MFIALLTALGVIQFLKDSFSGTLVLIALSLAIGALLAFGYSRAEPVRSFLSVLSPAPLVLLFVFLFVSPVSDIVTAGDAEAKDVKGGSRAPIVFLGLDEFPGISITGLQGADRRQALPGHRRAGEQEHLVPQRALDLRLHQPRLAGDHGRQLPGQGKAPARPRPTTPTASSRSSARATR